MQTVISKYGLAAHLALLAVTPLILSPFCELATVATYLVWMSVIGAVWLVMEPSRKSDEMLHDARMRVLGVLVRDPLFWFFVVLTLFSAMVSFNGGVVRTYDAPQAKWIVTDPPCGFFPGCAKGCGLLVFATTLALAVVVEGCRLALGKSARIAFAAVFSIAASAAGIVLAFLGFHSESDVSSPGIAFGFALLSSIVAAAGIFESKWHRYLLLFSFAAGGSAVGLLYFSTPLVLVVFTALAILFFLGAVAYLAVFLGGADVAKFIVVILVAALIPVLLAICVVDSQITQTHTAVFLSLDKLPDCLFADGFWARRAALSDYAAAFWRDEMWTGCGVGVFPLKLWTSGGAAKGLSSATPLNGWWFLLAERGIIGVTALVIPLLLMLYSFGRRVYIAIRFARMAFYPLVALGVLALIAAIALGFVDASVMRPDVSLATFAFFALAASSLPLPRLKDEDSDAKNK